MQSEAEDSAVMARRELKCTEAMKTEVEEACQHMEAKLRDAQRRLADLEQAKEEAEWAATEVAWKAGQALGDVHPPSQGGLH
ncbi:hypothetical protein E2562_017334 [Oryza meyeriana var. granulata]|uniref:Uncharacterized protein n=1 Tax=Oryza meyeriana var. granulata TaxID=110450 RepID=A0A6G1BW80_9ORYZ|nr:hypothetical protein E2562_017334 [Oryza meyeriana var. granulata]